MLKRTINENGLSADLFLPEENKKNKTIIMLGGSEGGKSWSRIRQVISHLTERGYNLLSTAYFKAPGLPDTLQEIPLDMFEKIFAWLAVLLEVFPDQYAIIGGSKGAELGLLLASRYPQIKTVVAISPSSVVWQGIPKKRFQLDKEMKSSWSFNGKSLPFIPYSITKKDTGALLTLRLRKIHERALRDSKKIDKAVIPVERVQGAVLLISGEKDQMWPAVEMGQQITSRLAKTRFQYPYEHQKFNTGHNGLIMNREVWRNVFSFLDENFPPDRIR